MLRFMPLAVLGLTFLLADGLVAGDWPRFRGPNGSGVSDDQPGMVRFIDKIDREHGNGDGVVDQEEWNKAQGPALGKGGLARPAQANSPVGDWQVLRFAGGRRFQGLRH